MEILNNRNGQKFYKYLWKTWNTCDFFIKLLAFRLKNEPLDNYISAILSKFKEQLIHREFLKVVASNYSNLLSLAISFPKSNAINNTLLGSYVSRVICYKFFQVFI